MSQNLDNDRSPGACTQAQVRYVFAVCGTKSPAPIGKKYQCVVCKGFFYEPPVSRVNGRPLQLSCPHCYESHFEEVQPTSSTTAEFSLLFRLGATQKYLILGAGPKEFLKSKARDLRKTFSSTYVEMIVVKGKHQTLPVEYLDEVYRFQYGG